jgi:osmotically-inducible protein OsmY
LFNDPVTESYEVSVEADEDGKVQLTGMVDSWQEKNLTESVVKGVRGVTAIENAIEIEFASRRLDTEIRPEIERRLQWDVLVDHGLIDVAVDAGVVTLSGIVGSAAEKRRARNDAWVGGVKSVDVSGLTIERWARDEDLRRPGPRRVIDADHAASLAKRAAR